MRPGLATRTYYSAHNLVRTSSPLSRIAWSTLRRIGRSRLMALTIVVPFLGTLILFNENVVSLFRLSSDFVARWYGEASATPIGVDRISMTRMYYLYFGLSMLGFASGLFALFCPIEVKSYESPVEYVMAEGEHHTKARMRLLLPDISTEYLKWCTTDDTPFALPRPLSNFVRWSGEPQKFVFLYYQVMYELLLQSSLFNPEHEGGFCTTERGEPDPDAIANIFVAPAGVERGAARDLGDDASKPEFRGDVLTLQYLSRDNTRPWVRLIIATLYGGGFLLLLIPTAETFLRVLAKLV